jgi:hypothetical protein
MSASRLRDEEDALRCAWWARRIQLARDAARAARAWLTVAAATGFLLAGGMSLVVQLLRGILSQ